MSAYLMSIKLYETPIETSLTLYIFFLNAVAMYNYNYYCFVGNGMESAVLESSPSRQLGLGRPNVGWCKYFVTKRFQLYSLMNNRNEAYTSALLATQKYRVNPSICLAYISIHWV
jgi:hypothetical protein